MEIDYSGRQIIIKGKYSTLLDKFVLHFVQVLEERTSYVIVSGYVAILFGRSRGTEDVDILIPSMNKEMFITLHQVLLDAGYEFLNAEDGEGLHDMLANRMGIRIAQIGQVIPNIELTFLKDDIDRCVLKDRLDVRIPDGHLFISPVEIQIAYKLFLGSEKDIEDAIYLWEIFKEYLNCGLLKMWMKNFDINGDDYGISV